MSITPPPPPPMPSSRKPFTIALTGKTLLFTGLGAAVALAAVTGIVVSQSGNDDRAAKNAQNAKLYDDYTSGKLPPSAYQTTTTTTDANGNVSVSTEPAQNEPGQDGQMRTAGPNGGSYFATGDDTGTPANTAGMNRVWLADASAGMQNAMSLSIPTGWRFQGEVVRNVPCSPGDAYPRMNAASPDNAYALTVMTPFFTAPSDPGLDMRSCGTIAHSTSAANILSHYVVPTLRRDAQVSAPEAVPGAEQFLHGGGQDGNGMMSSNDAARVHVTYTQNGQNVEEYIVGYTTTMRRQGMPDGTTSTIIDIYKAPAGQLDGFYQRAASTMALTANPQWQQRDMQMAQKNAQQIQQRGEQVRVGIQQQGQDAGAAGRAMLARTRDNIAATGQRSSDNAVRSEAARHSGAVGTMDLVGDRAPQTYFFCNNSGGYTTNNNPNPPGPGWYTCR